MEILRSYFDGGNQGDSSQYTVVSLAVVSGTADLWTAFENDWNETLKKHHAAYLHTTDVIARAGIFQSWSEAQCDAFLTDCVEIAGKHCARPIHGDSGKYGLLYVTVCIVLKDFVEFAASHNGFPSNVNESLLRQALAEVLPWSIEQAACDQCHFFFDQGEPFYGHLVQLLQNKKARKDATALNRISYSGEADMRFTPALQLADLYAWGQCHRTSSRKQTWLQRLLETWVLWQWIDKTNMHLVDQQQHAIWASWKIPTRRATR